MIPLRRDPKGPESHRLIFGCAGVKPTSEGKPQNHVSWFSVPAGTLCATWALRVALSAPPLVGCVPSGTLPRFLQLKSSLESAVEFIRVEKTAYRLLQETLGSTPQGPETSESHQPFVGPAGVKPTSERKRPKTTSPAQCSCRNTGARLGRSEWHSPQPPFVGCVPSGTLLRSLHSFSGSMATR